MTIVSQAFNIRYLRSARADIGTPKDLLGLDGRGRTPNSGSRSGFRDLNRICLWVADDKGSGDSNIGSERVGVIVISDRPGHRERRCIRWMSRRGDNAGTVGYKGAEDNDREEHDGMKRSVRRGDSRNKR